MASKASSAFRKYTAQPVGIWQRIYNIFGIDGNRSTGVPLNPYYRNPAPAGNDPKAYDDPTTVPAADLADNPYWKRDTRRSYPQLSVRTQGDVVGLLTVGSEAQPKDDVLKLGDQGLVQLLEVKEEGDKGGLPVYFEKNTNQIKSVFSADGLPPKPINLGQNNVNRKQDRLELADEQTYPSLKYPCRSWT